MTATRPLAGLTVNLSVSESDDSARRGFPFWQVNRVTLQFVAALFGQGDTTIELTEERFNHVRAGMFFLHRRRGPRDYGFAKDLPASTDEPVLRVHTETV